MNAFFVDDDGDRINLYALEVYEDCDSFEIITQVRQSALKRGSVGNLIIVHKSPLDNKNIEDCHRDLLLRRIEVESNQPDEAIEWKYIFLKN
jgi:hypothetical protein